MSKEKKEEAKVEMVPVDVLARSLSLVDKHKYAAARAIHQWDVYAHNYAKEWEMEPSEFLKAIQAAAAYPAVPLVESAKPKKG